MFCKKQDHFIRQFRYCEDCAIKGKEVRIVFFCERCHVSIRNMHAAHKTQVCYLNHDKFMKPLQHMKDLLKQQIQIVKQKCQKANMPNFDGIINGLKKDKLPNLKLFDQKQLLSHLLLNPDVMKWLLEIKFWQAGKAESYINFQKNMKNSVEVMLIDGDKSFEPIFKPTNVSILVNQFDIVWPQNNVDSEIERELGGLNTEMQRHRKQKQIFSLVIKLFSSYNVNQCYDTIDDCSILQKRYPDSKVVQLAKIRLNQLLPQGHNQIPRILKKIVQIQPKFQFSDIYYYYMAMSQWQMIDLPKEEKGKVFFQLKNKRYYKILNVDEYINCLNKAIAVKQKSVYYASLGIGFIVKENLQEALRVFKSATSLLSSRNDAVELNKFWVQSHKENPTYEFQSIMQNLQTRTLQFITNLCKYFKKSKVYAELLLCCQQLIVREPNNVNFKIQFIKSILNYSSILQEIKGSDSERISKASMMIIELKRVRQMQANKLQKRLNRMKAYHDFKKEKFSDASEGYEKLAKGTNLTSASDYYNHASSLFQQFIRQHCDEEMYIKEAYEAISKAIKLKAKKKYIRLKFFTCCYMNLFNEANKLYERFLKDDKEYGVDPKQYTNLIDHVKNNMENDYEDRWETPGRD